jgi:hypothetical protein
MHSIRGGAVCSEHLISWIGTRQDGVLAKHSAVNPSKDRSSYSLSLAEESPLQRE